MSIPRAFELINRQGTISRKKTLLMNLVQNPNVSREQVISYLEEQIEKHPDNLWVECCVRHFIELTCGSIAVSEHVSEVNRKFHPPQKISAENMLDKINAESEEQSLVSLIKSIPGTQNHPSPILFDKIVELSQNTEQSKLVRMHAMGCLCSFYSEEDYKKPIEQLLFHFAIQDTEEPGLLAVKLFLRIYGNTEFSQYWLFETIQSGYGLKNLSFNLKRAGIAAEHYLSEMLVETTEALIQEQKSSIEQISHLNEEISSMRTSWIWDHRKLNISVIIICLFMFHSIHYFSKTNEKDGLKKELVIVNGKVDMPSRSTKMLSSVKSLPAYEKPLSTPRTPVQNQARAQLSSQINEFGSPIPETSIQTNTRQATRMLFPTRLDDNDAMAELKFSQNGSKLIEKNFQVNTLQTDLNYPLEQWKSTYLKKWESQYGKPQERNGEYFWKTPYGEQKLSFSEMKQRFGKIFSFKLSQKRT